MSWVYITLMLATLLGPLVMSFESKIRYRTKWKKLLLSTALPATFFILWDIIFTYKNVWEFNPEYHIDLYILNLPLEEWLFFFVVPFACIFIVENVMLLTRDKEINSRAASLALLAIIIPLSFIFYDRIYSLTTFTLLSVAIIHFEFFAKSGWLGKFYIGWAICLVPYFIVNGILTSLPVVIYDNTENMGLRIGSIPFEDAFYGMLLLLLISGYYFDSRGEGEANNELFINEPQINQGIRQISRTQTKYQ